MKKIRWLLTGVSLILFLSCLSPELADAATDKTKPTISGASNTIAYLNHSFNPRTGVKAKDNVDGNITDLIKISGKVNTKKTGKYTLTYKVTDKAKNTRIVKRVITVKKDTTKPKITGASNKTVYKGYSFNPKTGVKATDNADGNITSKIKVSGKVNTKKTGKYKIKYTVTDKTKNKTTVTRTITVKKDTTKPKITGATSKTVYKGYSFNPRTGVKASDNVDGNITSKIKISGKANPNEVGTYKLKYTVQDKTGNKATVTRTITVKKDTTKPKITGASNKTIKYGESFNPKTGVKATDNLDGTITNKMTVSGSVNRYKLGTYKLTYTVKDKTGNKTVVTRTVTVVDKTSPVFSGNLEDSKRLMSSADTFNPLSGIKAKDNVDGDLTAKIKVQGEVNLNKAGTYTLIYTVTDKSGNSAKVEKKITVVDDVLPILEGVDYTSIQFFDDFDPMKGVKATDNNDGDITSKVKVEGKIDTSCLQPGDYMLYYTVTDAAGNEMKLKRQIQLTERYVEYKGVENLAINIGEKIDPLEGVTVTDLGTGKDVTSYLKVEHRIGDKAGDYNIVYSLPEEKGYGYSSVIHRVVTVVDNVPPVISGVRNWEFNTWDSWDWSDFLEGVSAEDNNDGDLTSAIQIDFGDFTTGKAGEYDAYYIVYDEAYNVTKEKFTITVKNIPVTKITVTSDVKESVIKTGHTIFLFASIEPDHASIKDVVWESSDESIATVDESGTVFTLKEGTVTFTAKGDGGVTGDLTITVTDKPKLSFDGWGLGSQLEFYLANNDLDAAYVDAIKIYNNTGSVALSYSKEELESMGMTTSISPSESIQFVIQLGKDYPSIINGGKLVVFAGPKGGNTYEYTLDLGY